MIIIRYKRVYFVEGYILTINGLPARLVWDDNDLSGRPVYSKECQLYHSGSYRELRASIKRQLRRVKGLKDRYRIIRIISYKAEKRKP